MSEEKADLKEIQLVRADGSVEVKNKGVVLTQTDNTIDFQFADYSGPETTELLETLLLGCLQMLPQDRVVQLIQSRHTD